MQVAGDAGTAFRVAAQLTDQALQLGRCGSAVPGAIVEQGFQIGALDILGTHFKTGLAILAGFNQVVEYGNDFFSIFSSDHTNVSRGRGGSLFLTARTDTKFSFQDWRCAIRFRAPESGSAVPPPPSRSPSPPVRWCTPLGRRLRSANDPPRR